jgi:hypothetical protein
LADIKQLQRNQLFFGQWEYAVSFDSPLARYLRSVWSCEQTRINILQSFMYFEQYAAAGMLLGQLPAVQRYRHLEQLKQHTMIAFNQWIHHIECDHRLTRMYTTIYIYANDLSFLPGLEQWQVDCPDMVCNLRVHQAHAVIPQDEVWMNVPKHSFRTYLSLTSPVRDKNLLWDFLQNYGKELRMSPGLKAWFGHDNRLTSQSTYFIDHNHMSVLTAMGLISPGIVGRTVSIQARPG